MVLLHLGLTVLSWWMQADVPYRSMDLKGAEFVSI